MNKFDKPSVIFGAGCMAMCGSYLFDLMPLIIAAAGTDFGFTNTELGDLASSIFLGFTLAALSSVFWIRKINWQFCALIGGAILVVPLFLGSELNVFSFLYITMFIAGIGSGILYSLGTAIFGESSNTDRAFGIKLGIEAIPGAIGLLLIPIFFPNISFKDLAIVSGISLTLLVFGLFFIPIKGIKVYQPIEKTISSPKLVWIFPVLGLVCCFLFFSNFSGTWAFVEKLGGDKQIDTGLIGLIASVGFVNSVIGGFAAAAIGDRFGRIPPMIAAFILYFISLYLLGTFNNSFEFGLGVFIFMLLSNFILAYIVGTTTTVDVSGKIFVLTAAALSIGAIVGPAVTGRLVDSLGYSAMLTFSGITAAASLILYLIIARRANHIK